VALRLVGVMDQGGGWKDDSQAMSQRIELAITRLMTITEMDPTYQPDRAYMGANIGGYIAGLAVVS
jgi:hypothetical protein